MGVGGGRGEAGAWGGGGEGRGRRGSEAGKEGVWRPSELQALVYILPLEEGAGKRSSECGGDS